MEITYRLFNFQELIVKLKAANFDAINSPFSAVIDAQVIKKVIEEMLEIVNRNTEKPSKVDLMTIFEFIVSQKTVVLGRQIDMKKMMEKARERA
jgi:nucleoid DNA-binding protein